MDRIRRALAVALALALPALAAADSHPKLGREEFRADMRKLWEDHVTYTAFFYTAAIHGGDDAGALAGRLLANQDDIGAAVKPFYGDEAGDALAALLRDHILIAARLVAAAKAGDATGFEHENAAWFANADDIAAFLAGANPHWPQDTLREALRMHLVMTTEAVVAKLQGNTAAAVDAYDRGHVHMLGVADVLAAGIQRQFPRFFRD